MATNKSTRKHASLIERFWRYVSPEPNSGCWLWTGSGTYGYGTIGRGKRIEMKVIAHRLSYELHIGPIPEGLVLDHLCRVRCCVNPQHLEPVTNEENIRRGEAGKYQSRRTHCPSGHEYSPENTQIHRATHRLCKACHKVNARASYLRLRAKRLQLAPAL